MATVSEQSGQVHFNSLYPSLMRDLLYRMNFPIEQKRKGIGERIESLLQYLFTFMVTIQNPPHIFALVVLADSSSVLRTKTVHIWGGNSIRAPL